MGKRRTFRVDRSWVRGMLKSCFAMGVVIPAINTFCIESSFGQLRTGRETQRNFYGPSDAVGVPKPVSVNGEAVSNRSRVKSKSKLEGLKEDRNPEELPRVMIAKHDSPTGSAARRGAVVPAGAVEMSDMDGDAIDLIASDLSMVQEEVGSNEVILERVRETSGRTQSGMQNSVVRGAAQRSGNFVASSGYKMKRVTPVRSTSGQTLIQENAEVLSNPSEGEGVVVDGVGAEVEGYTVDDPVDGWEANSWIGRRMNHGETCGDPSCSQCGGDYPSINIRIGVPRLFQCCSISARVEAATFWPTAQGIPQLVRTAEIGQPGSQDLFGGTRGTDETVQGLRGEFGWRFGVGGCNQVQFRFFDAGAQSLTFDSPISGATSIVRPYQDPVPTPNTQEAVSILEPGISNGSLLAHAYSKAYGGDLLLKRVWAKDCDATTEWLAGYQSARLTDFIDVHSTTTPIGTPNVLELRDQFRAVNQFHGGALGISRIVYDPRWSLGGMFKLGMGNMQRDVTITGFQRVNNATPTAEGLLARSSNNGFYSSNTFVFSPEVNITLGYRLTNNLEATVGYNYLGLPKVARGGEQIDTAANLNSNTPSRPAFSLHESNFHLHSLNYGLQYRY